MCSSETRICFVYKKSVYKKSVCKKSVYKKKNIELCVYQQAKQTLQSDF